MPRPNAAEATDFALRRFRSWLATASQGDSYTYHVGLLACDRYEARTPASDGGLGYQPVEPFDSVAREVYGASKAGLVSLWQYRNGPAEYEYVARRTKRATHGSCPTVEDVLDFFGGSVE